MGLGCSCGELVCCADACGVPGGKRNDAMLAIGCLIPFVTLALGAAIGSYFGDIKGGYWGAGTGFLAGLLLAGIAVAVLGRMRRRV